MMAPKERSEIAVPDMCFFAVAKTPPSVGWKWWKAVHVLVLNMHDQRRFSAMRRSSQIAFAVKSCRTALLALVWNIEIFIVSVICILQIFLWTVICMWILCQLALRDHQVWMIHCQREIRVVISLGKHMLCPDHPKMNMAYPRHLAKKWCFSAWLVELCIQIDCTRSKVPLILQSIVR